MSTHLSSYSCRAAKTFVVVLLQRQSENQFYFILLNVIIILFLYFGELEFLICKIIALCKKCVEESFKIRFTVYTLLFTLTKYFYPSATGFTTRSDIGPARDSTDIP